MPTTLPWHLKAGIIGFDCVTFLMKPQREEADSRVSSDMYRSMLQVSLLYLLVTLATICPSVFLSVKNRENTNSAVEGVISQLHVFTWILTAASENLVSVEHACYSLQFCFCYSSFCLWQASSSDRFLFAGNVYVKHSSFIAMLFFPLIFSKVLVNGMHMSPYIIPITFSGEVAGMCSRCITLVITKLMSLL